MTKRGTGLVAVQAFNSTHLMSQGLLTIMTQSVQMSHPDSVGSPHEAPTTCQMTGPSTVPCCSRRLARRTCRRVSRWRGRRKINTVPLRGLTCLKISSFIICFYAIMHRTTIVQNKIIIRICSCLFFVQLIFIFLV